MNAHIADCDAYLASRTGKYEWRRVRYMAALGALQAMGISNDDTVVDVGAGWTEFDYCLRVDGDLRCRYIPVDGGIDGVDLEEWRPPRPAQFFVALEILEHLHDPWRLVRAMQVSDAIGIVVSTPNPETTDVLAMDPTHKTPIDIRDLHRAGFDQIDRVSFYGQEDDSLFAIWRNYV